MGMTSLHDLSSPISQEETDLVRFVFNIIITFVLSYRWNCKDYNNHVTQYKISFILGFRKKHYLLIR